jgi:glycosyltransferase involved in cell wall biosynthesis
MKVSVVIPTYSRARYIGEAVRSVLSQTYRDLEVIVVDDGSTDDTEQVLAALADSRMRYLVQAHRGASAALNHGWRAARGEYIGRLDSDDVWQLNLLQELVPLLDHDDSVGLAYARARWMDAQGLPLTPILGASEKFRGRTLESLLYGDFVCPMALLLRREALESVGGFDESLSASVDWDLWIRLASSWRFAYRDRVLAWYRCHGENLTAVASSGLDRLIRDRLRVLEKFFASGAVTPETLAIKGIAYRNLHLDFALRHLTAGQRRAALSDLRRALAASPSWLTFFPRALAFLLAHRYLDKTAWGARLIDGWVKWRRRPPAE